MADPKDSFPVAVILPQLERIGNNQDKILSELGNLKGDLGGLKQSVSHLADLPERVATLEERTRAHDERLDHVEVIITKSPDPPADSGSAGSSSTRDRALVAGGGASAGAFLMEIGHYLWDYIFRSGGPGGGHAGG